MTKHILDIPLLLQEKGSVNCGIVCLQMLLTYCNIRIPAKEVQSLVHPGVGSYVGELGEFLEKKGFTTRIQTLNPRTFTKSMQNFSQQRIRKHLARLQSSPAIDCLKEYSGVIQLSIPSIEDIRAELAEGRPVIALLTTNFLSKDTPSINSHFVLVTGADEEHIYVNDPLGEMKQISITEFFFALHANVQGDYDNGSLLYCEKNN